MEELRFHGKYRIPSARLQDWDYATNAYYFVTICTKNREYFLGEISNGNIQYSVIGDFACNYLRDINQYATYTCVDTFVVMPNHIHLLVFLRHMQGEYRQNKFGTLREKSISSVINHFKGRVTKFANSKGILFGWQERYHDHIVRDNDDYQRIYQYISNNVDNWRDDQFHG